MDRQADDLRALIFSSAVYLTQTEFAMLGSQLRGAYGHPEVLARLRCQVARPYRPTTFQLAQAPLTHAAARALRDELVRSLA